MADLRSKRRLYMESVRLAEFHINRLKEYSGDEKLYENMARAWDEAKGDSEFNTAVTSLGEMALVINTLTYNMEQSPAVAIATRTGRKQTQRGEREFDTELMTRARTAYKEMWMAVNSDETGIEFLERLAQSRFNWSEIARELPDKAKRLIALAYLQASD